MSSGNYDLINLAEAREKREIAHKQVAKGIDSVEERNTQKLAQQLSTEVSVQREPSGHNLKHTTKWCPPNK